MLHVLFNVMWIRQLAPAVAELYGAGRMVIIYTVAGVTGFGMSSLLGVYLPGCQSSAAPTFSVGASAPIFGLLGALVYYGRRTGNSHAGTAGLQYALFLGIFGLIFPGCGQLGPRGRLRRRVSGLARPRPARRESGSITW